MKKKTIILVVFFLATLLFRYYQYYTFREFNADKARQLHGAYSLMQGKGLSYESYDLKNFQSLLKPVNDWPPAYSYIVAGIAFATGTDLYFSSVILDILSITALWLLLFWITQLLKFNLIQQLLLFVFLGISKTILPRFLSADLLGVVLFLLSCCLTISFINNTWRGKSKTLFYLLQAIIISSLIFLKFSLIPAAAAIGVSLLIMFLNTYKRQYIKQGIFLFLLFVLGVSLLFLYNNQISGNSVTFNRVTTEKTLYFENLLLFNPFIVSSLFYLDPLYLRFDWKMIDNVALVITLIFLLVFCIFIIKNVLRKQAEYFGVLLFTTLLAISSFLIIVSLKFPKDDDGDYQWTFVNEYRYFAPVIILFIIYCFKNFKLTNHRNKFSLLFSLLIGFSFVTTFLLEGYYLVRNNKSTSFENLYGTVFSVAEYVKNNSDENTYFMSFTNHWPTDTEITSLVALHGTKVAVSYSNYFPKSSINEIFSPDASIQRGKKIIVYFGNNEEALNRINKNNSYTIQEHEGQQLLVIKN